MRPMRGGFRPVFPGLRSAAAKLAVALIVGTVLYALLAESVGALLLLVPEAVLRGFVWQPLTYGFISDSPWGGIFGALILWQIGGALEQSWGSRRMVAFAIGTTVLAGVATVLLALVLPALRLASFAGGFVMGLALWVAYGLGFGRRQTSFWGLPVSGYMLALIGVGIVFLQGAFSRPRFLPVIPEALALLLTWAYLRLGGPSDWLLRLRSWRFQRQLRSRSKHLTLVSPDRNTPRDSDRFLQ